jgi:hypothetical protein
MFKTVSCKEFFDLGTASIRVWTRLSDARVAFDNRIHKAGTLTSGPE